VSNYTEKVAIEIFKAYDAIHSLDVIHGDVRAENVLVGKDGKSVWLVDFEFSEILSGESTERYKISQEKEAVSYLLSKFKDMYEANRTHTNGSGAIP
jgi:serine/threonine protein kinase